MNCPGRKEYRFKTDRVNYAFELIFRKLIVRQLKFILNKEKSIFAGYTPLMTSANVGNEEIARILIEKGANVNATNDDKDSALTMAAMGSKNQ